jgi:uncharacterized OB-fold protein
MTPGVTIWRCKACGVAFFPERLLCPRCHGYEWQQDRIHEAVVEEVSTIRHMIGATDWTPRRIASVRTSEGLRITVGLRDDSGPGAAIALFEDGTAPYGELKAHRRPREGEDP